MTLFNFRVYKMINCMKRGILIILSVVLVITLFTFQSSTQQKNCIQFAKETNFPLGTLLLDKHLLRSINDGNCIIKDRTITIALPMSFTNTSQIDLTKFNIYLYNEQHNGNYLQFYSTEKMTTVRAIPIITWRPFGKLLIPQDVTQFVEFWRRSRKIECRNITMKREESEPVINPIEAAGIMHKLQKVIIDNGMYPFMVFGTELGWYRECGIIPHTYDVDFSILAETYNTDLFDILYSEKYGFGLSRQFGRPNNNYELTIYPLQASATFTIDLFLMYTNFKNESWMGGTGNKGHRIHFVFPLYNKFCAADLYGYLFWVSCTPERMIQLNYGPDWHSDKPTSKFAWYDQPNTRNAGKWPDNELNETVRIFKQIE